MQTAGPLTDPDRIFGGLPAVSDAAVAAPAVVRALVASGANVLSVGEAHHSLEDVYLELIGADAAAVRR